jgi:hypothetical protein
VVTIDFPGLRDFVERDSCGKVVLHEKQTRDAILEPLADCSFYSHNPLRCRRRTSIFGTVLTK